jgi:WXG100 family type VII secretion target
MVDQTRAEIAGLQSFASATEQSANDISRNLQTLLGNLSTLHGNWKGHGGDNFRVTSDTVNREMTKIHQLLTEMANDVRTAGIKYAGADSDQGREMRNIQAATTDITAGLS